MADIKIKNSNVRVIPQNPNVNEPFTVEFTINNRELVGTSNDGSCQVGDSPPLSPGHLCTPGITISSPSIDTVEVRGYDTIEPQRFGRDNGMVCAPLDTAPVDPTIQLNFSGIDTPGAYTITAFVDPVVGATDSESVSLTVEDVKDDPPPNGGNGGGGGGGGGNGGDNGPTGSPVINFAVNNPGTAAVIGLGGAFIADRTISALFQE